MHNHLLIIWLEVVYVIVAINAFVKFPPLLLRSDGVICSGGNSGCDTPKNSGSTMKVASRLYLINPQDKVDIEESSESKDVRFLSSDKSISAPIERTPENNLRSSKTNNGYEDSTQQQPKYPVDLHEISSLPDNGNKILLQPKYRSMLHDLLEKEREKIEYRHKKNVARLKMALATTRQELIDMEEKFSKLEAMSLKMELNLTKTMSENTKKLKDLNRSWENKYTTQIELLMEEKNRALALIDQKVSTLKLFSTRTIQMENKCEDMEKSVSMEVENKLIALDELERELTLKYETEIGLMNGWARGNATKFDEYKRSTAEQITQVQTRSNDEKMKFEKRIDRVRDDLNVARQKLKNERRYHGTFRKKMNLKRRWLLVELKKSRKQLSNDLKRMAEEYSEKIKAFMNASSLKEAELVQERDNALLQFYSVQLENERLQDEMYNKTKEWEGDLLKLQEEAGKEMIRLEKELSNQLSAAEDLANNDTRKKEKEVARDKLVFRNEWADRVQITEKTNRKELVELMRLHEEQLSKTSKLQEEELANVKGLSKQLLKVLKKRTINRYKMLEERIGLLNSTRIRLTDLFKRIMKRNKKKQKLLKNIKLPK